MQPVDQGQPVSRPAHDDTASRMDSVGQQQLFCAQAHAAALIQKHSASMTWRGPEIREVGPGFLP